MSDDSPVASPPIDMALQLEQTKQQLAYQQKLHDSLLYAISHDLRTPVMTVLGFADMLTSDLGDTPNNQHKRQYLDHIRSSATRQAAMIEYLLYLAQLAKQPLHIEATDLTQLAFQVWQQRPESNDKHFTIKLHPTTHTRGDQALLTLLLQELLDNAVKFANQHTHPEIEFGSVTQHGVTQYYLRDNGVGFDIAQADRLGQPFRRLHSAKSFPGLGKGLATATLIVERHGGRLWFDSALHQGTTAWFTLVPM